MAPPPLPLHLSAAQQVQQFLNTALCQGGHGVLPYAEETKWLIRQHLVYLAETYPSLHIESSLYTHNDGRTVYLLQADGTIPIVYGGVIYNIPASIWLLERYPLSPPSVFLKPTRDMVIKFDHPHVDRSGFVRVPYLQSWVYPSSNLVDLVRSLSQIFSSDPPLYSRQNPNPNPTPNPMSSPIRNASTSRVHSSLSSPTEDAPKVYRRNSVSKIVDVVHVDITWLRKARESEIKDLLTTQAILQRREEELAGGFREAVDEKEGLEQQLQLALMNTDLLETWLRENGLKWLLDVDVDDAFEPADAMSRKMMECTAADLAVEDTVYTLENAVQEGSIPFELYLKNVRALSREQFFHRAMATKVRGAQLHARITNMTARLPQHES